MTKHDPLHELWASEEKETFTMSIAELSTHSSHLSRRVRRRNRVEYLAAALVVSIFSWMGYVVPVWPIRVGALMIIAGAFYVCWKLNEIASASDPDPLVAAESLANHHRRELVRQRDALRSVWRWYLLPFVPGIVVFIVGTSIQAGADLSLWITLTTAMVGLGLVSLFFAGVWVLNQHAAREINAEIQALDAKTAE